MIAILTSFILSVAAAPAADFSAHWHDGRAEIDGYRLRVQRYGEERVGEAVLIYVTEPFSESRRVKVDDPSREPADVVDVLKLNLVRDFQTGIYDYNTMTSVFSRSDDFSPMKVTFSSAEWCGHVFEEAVFRPGGIEGSFHSYFERESGPIDLPLPEGGVIEDNLFILLRGLRGAWLAPGAKKTVPFLPGAYWGRLHHRPLAWTTAEISRGRRMETVVVPAGSFSAIVYRVRVADGREGVFHVEEAWPHRILKWSLLPDVSGELTGTQRVTYWTLNGNGEERRRKDLGLE